MFGSPRTRAWQDGLPPHNKLCPCKRCAAGRYKTNASRRERKIGKDLGARRNPGSGAWGGSDILGAVCEIEETASVVLTRGLFRWWNSKQIQEKTAVIRGQRLKPAAFVASFGGRPRLVVMEWESYRNLCERADGS